MKKTYIPIKVHEDNKLRTWYLDVTNSAIEELITLKKELDGMSTECLDAVIYDRTCSSAFMHQMRAEKKQEGKRRYQKKLRRR